MVCYFIIEQKIERGREREREDKMIENSMKCFIFSLFPLFWCATLHLSFLLFLGESSSTPLVFPSFSLRCLKITSTGSFHIKLRRMRWILVFNTSLLFSFLFWCRFERNSFLPFSSSSFRHPFLFLFIPSSVWEKTPTTVEWQEWCSSLTLWIIIRP